MTFMLMLGAALLAPTSSSAASAGGDFTVTGVAAITGDGMIPLSVATGDLDGDGAADGGTLLIRCDGGSVTEALFQSAATAREAGSGMATGKRAIVVPHVFETSRGKLDGMRLHWDLKEAKGARFFSRKGYDYY